MATRKQTQPRLQQALDVHREFPRVPTCTCSAPEACQQAIDCASEILLGQAQNIIRRISNLGFSKKELAYEISASPAEVSMSDHQATAPNLSLAKRAEIARKLRQCESYYRAKRLGQLLGDAAIISPIEACSNAGHFDEMTSKVAVEIVRSNLSSAILEDPTIEDPVTSRLPLPEGVEAILALVGRLEWGLLLIQYEPELGTLGLSALINVLEQLLSRLKSTLEAVEGIPVPMTVTQF